MFPPKPPCSSDCKFFEPCVPTNKVQTAMPRNSIADRLSWWRMKFGKAWEKGGPVYLGKTSVLITHSKP
jgi:hypothetical protein